MVLLTVRDLARQFDAEPVFQHVTFDVRAGEKIGIVGPNGAGKTTLLRCLAKLDHPDEGAIEMPKTARMGFLQQHANFAPGQTLINEVKSGLGHLYELQEQATQIALQMGDASNAELESLQVKYDQLHHELERLNAYEIDHQVEEVLHGLNFEEQDYERPLSSFSGGQQNRALLARLLLESPDVMLLDEPTNHLDIATTEWLEDYLAKTSQAIIVVSHDRYFLDKVTTRTLEVFKGGVQDYPGNFSKYWELRAERRKVLERTHEKQQDYIAKQEQFIRKNQYGTKASRAKDRARKLEKIEQVELPPEFTEIPMGFSEPSRTGDWVFRTEEISKGFPSPETGEVVSLFNDITLQIDRGERIGIIGPNGAGKTTFLRVLIDELKPDAGTIRHGANLEISYFDQQMKNVDHNSDGVDAARPEKFPDMTPGQVRSVLGRFGITGDMGLQKLFNMSGGEKAKVALAKLAAEKPNVMILDEPTNHLDFWACAALERSLRNFEGTILFVSHDRYFLDQVATRIFSLEPGHWTDFPGNYSELQDMQTFREKETQPAKSEQPVAQESKPQGKPKERRKRKFPFRKVEDIEADIANHEARIMQLELDLGDPDVHKDANRLQATQEEYETTQDELADLMEHWEEALELN